MKRKQIILLTCALLLLLAIFASCKKDAQQVNLTMVANNGSADTVVQVEAGKAYTLPTLTREGYEFAGWYTKSDFTGDAVTSVSPAADATVYAKWDKLYTLTLDPAGGTLGTTTLTLKAGDKLAEKLAGLVPERADSQFGMWMLNGEALSNDAVMGAEDATLVARYKVKYTVDIYLQNTALNGYEKAAESITGYEYAGAAFTSAETVKGFAEVAKSDSVTRLVLSDDASKNVFRHYFDRASYTLTFVSNYPDGSDNDRKTEKLIYGVETEIPFPSFTMSGYFLEGWATTAGGKMVYSSHLMDGKLYNGETTGAKETITAEGNVTLYAVWSKGYTNLFGGEDILYVSTSEANTVYLYRGDRYFKGMLTGKNIIFPDASVDFPQGVLNSDGETFLFLNSSRAEISATLYEVGKGLNELVKLYLTSANGVTYSVKESESSTTTTDSTGEFFFTDDGNMIATFTSGPLAGKTIIFVMGNITISGETRTAFQVRNEDEVDLGKILFFTVKNNTIVANTDDSGASVGDITLNGFGVATYNGGSSTTTFYYVYDAEKGIITLRDSSGQNSYVLKLMTINGELGYMIYNASADVSYDLADGSKLSTDGMRTATFVTADGKTASGFFSTATSAFGGTLLSFTDLETGTQYLFMISSKTVQIPVDPTKPDGDSKNEVQITVEQKQPGYAEYYYKDGAGTYYAPLFVFDSADRTKVTVYGYNKLKEFHKIAAGTMTYDEATGTYTLTVTEHFELPEGTEPVFTTPIDFSTVKSCVLMLDNTTTQYSINFWFNYNNGVETVDLTKVYTGKNNGKLTLVGGLAIYQVGDSTEIGTYKQSDSLVTVTFADSTLYFYLSDSDASYEVYSSTATTYYEVGKDGSILQTRFLVIDPKTSSITFYVITGEGEDQVTTKYEGKLTSTGTTSLTGFTIYEFNSIEKTAGTDTPVLSFRFIQRSTSATKNYIFVYDEAYAGSFISTNTRNGVLILDGFGFAATYTDGEGNEVMGFYQKDGNDVTISGDTSYYFLLNGDTCALRGSEYGKTYLLIDNRVFDGLFVEFDGIGTAKVFTMKSNGTETEREDIDSAAVYTANGEVVTLTYKVNNEERTLICKFGVYTVSDTPYNALNIVHDDVAFSYVNVDDWSVLRLNSDGTAIKYLTDGSVESGTYSLITETLLYYVNSSASEAFIYVYDREAGTATPRSYTATAYYTKDLDSLLFSQYGFAIFNNSTRYYYTVDEDGNVTLYHLDENATDKNKYGYVEENFGKLEDTREYGNKLYFKNDGFAITFGRDDASKDKYPVLVDSKTGTYLPTALLTFAPSGGETFSVTGQVKIGDDSYTCYVVKEIQDGKPVMYFRIGSYYFYININYCGDGVGSEAKSTYEVTGLSNIRSMPSYTYLYYLYYIYSTMGSSFASRFTNEFGTITMQTDYNEEGKAENSYLNATFGKSANFLDANGDLITTIENAPFSYLGSNGSTPFYQASFTGADGYRYSFVFSYTAVSVFQTYGYNVYALVREETVTANDGYEVTVGRVISSEANIEAGSYYSFLLKQNGETLEASNIIMVGGKLYYIVRTTDENGKVTATSYYQLTLVEKSSGSIENPDEGETEESKPLPIFESATVTKTDANVVYTADGGYYVDILPDNQILMMTKVTTSDDKTTTEILLIAECNYDAETGVYTLKTSDDQTFTVTVKDGGATVIEVAQTTGETEAA